MGSPQMGFCCHRNRHLIISLLFLLLSSSTMIQFAAQGRSTTKLHEAAIQHKKGLDEKVMIRTQGIGSTPPRCERRCSSCGHCEAVQVPVTTRILNHKGNHIFTAIYSIAYSRGDDISNYKPMSWKCKCGSLIFNP